MLAMLRGRGTLVVTTMLIRGVATASLAGRGTLVGTGTLGGLGRSDALRSLYPPIEPYRTGRLDVGSGHSVYYEECGNKAGKPVVFIHGGPGGGCTEGNRCFFDPALYRIILIDQRGAGRSTPTADLTDNTTWELIKDLEMLRETLGIDKWMCFGGSWGSTVPHRHSNPCGPFVLKDRVSGALKQRRLLPRTLPPPFPPPPPPPPPPPAFEPGWCPTHLQ